ncbi:hypothetical protein EDE15_3928 [Edaphobacter aggregans]|uniref:AAA ATPase-like protein n=1 Tax=Edaphobacter aggregans TaxID=570835 RepID=A0A428MN74_9BACT|nr:hypothetical protein [Edaphobacter aggregans]RSL18361.1 hypothetical protein EDE15_3928 [Edaphobacter aggregans]
MTEAKNNGLSDSVAALDNKLASSQLKPEDVEEVSDLLTPIERKVAALDAPPDVPESPAGKLFKLLWCKTHPVEADLRLILRLMPDSSPLVRYTATQAFKSTLDVALDRWSDPKFSIAASERVTECARQESSPLISYELDQIRPRLLDATPKRRRSRPKMAQNPYIVGPPIRDSKGFFGRQDILDRLRKMVASHGGMRAAVLYGARRTGKTSILFRIEAGEFGDSVVPVYLDMQGVAGSPLGTFLRILVRVIRKAAADLTDLAVGDPDVISVREYIESTLHRLGTKSLLLLIDEFELLEAYLSSGFAAQLQSLLDVSPNLFIIFAGSRKLESLRGGAFSNLLDSATYIKISFLDRNDATRMITEPIGDAISFPPEVVEKILTLTNAHPFYTQLMCLSIFDLALKSGKATPENVDEAVGRFLQNPAPHMILTWNAMRLGEAAVGSTVALLQSGDSQWVTPIVIAMRLHTERFPVDLTAADIQRALASLCDIDWIEQRRGGGEYRFTMELVRRWVSENRSISYLASKHQEELAARAVGFWKQRSASLIDWIVCGLLMTSAANATSWDPFPQILLAFMVPLAFLMILLFAGRATAGMFVLRLRSAPAPGKSLGKGRTAILGFAYTIRFFVEFALFKFIVTLPHSWRYIGFGRLSVAVMLAALVALDQVMMLRGSRHRGLYDKMAGTMVVPSEALTSW